MRNKRKSQARIEQDNEANESLDSFQHEVAIKEEAVVKEENRQRSARRLHQRKAFTTPTTLPRLRSLKPPKIEEQKITLKDVEMANKWERDLVPDENDPNCYCNVCKRRYSDRPNFRTHLQRMHKMEPKNYRRRKILHPELTPNEHDPNHYCLACEKTFGDNFRYKRHLKYAHKIELGPSKQTAIKKKVKRKAAYTNVKRKAGQDYLDSYCTICEQKYCNKYVFRNHLKDVHGFNLQQPQQGTTNPDIQPDQDDPNCYCRVCRRNYCNKYAFRNHLEQTHQMALQPLPKPSMIIHPDVQPDQDDPNFYCKACERKYKTKNVYNQHLRLIHDMNLRRPHRIIIHPDVQPDENDPNLYCRACERSYTTKPKYQTHLTKVHEMKLGLQQQLSNLEPDEDDPDFYCCKCDRKYSTKRTYGVHLRLVHNKYQVKRKMVLRSDRRVVQMEDGLPVLKKAKLK